MPRSSIRILAITSLLLATVYVATAAAKPASPCNKRCLATTTTTSTSTSTTSSTSTSTTSTTSTSTTSTTTSTAPPPAAPAPAATSAPEAQGTWQSPEGVTIEVASAGSWTIADVYRLLVANARDLERIGPSLKVVLQDTYATQVASSASMSGEQYTGFRAVLYLKGVNSTFASQPDAQFAHEYGHVWSLFHLYLSHQGAWDGYLQARGLDGDSRLDSSYTWDRREIIADDYRLLFGSAEAIAQRPHHLNSYLAAPATVPGLGSFLDEVWSP